MIVLDTNVVSELMRPAPSQRVMEWVASQRVTNLYTTSVTQAEVLHGILLMSAGRRRKEIEAAAHAMFNEEFDGRILGFSGNAAHAYAQIAEKRRKLGRPISQFDAQIAAIARSVGAAIATRNVADFEDCGIEILNPWGG